MRSLASTLMAAGLSCGCAPAGASLGCSGGQSTASAKGWIDSLTIHVIPAIGELPVGSITTGDVLKIVSPLGASKPTTARYIAQRLAQVFDYALEADHITLSPCNGALRTALDPQASRGQARRRPTPHRDTWPDTRRPRSSCTAFDRRNGRVGEGAHARARAGVPKRPQAWSCLWRAVRPCLPLPAAAGGLWACDTPRLSGDIQNMGDGATVHAMGCLRGGSGPQIRRWRGCCLRTQRLARTAADVDADVGGLRARSVTNFNSAPYTGVPERVDAA